MGSQMNVESALFSRLGIVNETYFTSDADACVGHRHLAWSSTELFLQCYSSESPSEDGLHFMCRAALLVCLNQPCQLATDHTRIGCSQGTFPRSIQYPRLCLPRFSQDLEAPTILGDLYPSLKAKAVAVPVNLHTKPVKALLMPAARTLYLHNISSHNFRTMHPQVMISLLQSASLLSSWKHAEGSFREQWSCSKCSKRV